MSNEPSDIDGESPNLAPDMDDETPTEIVFLDDGQDTVSTTNPKKFKEQCGLPSVMHSQVVTRMYIVSAFSKGGFRVHLYDLHSGEDVWVNALGYTEEIAEKLSNLWNGNIIQAIIAPNIDHSSIRADIDPGQQHEFEDGEQVEIVDDDFWYFYDFEKKYDSKLFYVESPSGVVPSPSGVEFESFETEQMDQWWQANKDDITDFLPIALRDEDKNVVVEMQLWHRYHKDAESGEVVDLYENMLEGKFVPSGYFVADVDPSTERQDLSSAPGLKHLDRAKALMVVAPQDKNYLSLLAFPEQDSRFKRYVEEVSTYAGAEIPLEDL